MASPAIRAAFLLSTTLLAGCAQTALTRSGALSSYEGLTPSDGILTRAGYRSNRERLLAAQTVVIIPTTLALNARDPEIGAEQVGLVANAINRTLCARLAERYRIVGDNQPADMTIRVTITGLTATNATAAGLSSLVGIGGTVASATTGLPIKVPRIPIGLGGLSVEAEALGRDRRSLAALLWSRGADILTTRPRASAEADAYAMASEFGNDFARLLTTGENPLKVSMSALPSARSMGEFLGVASGDRACAQFGRDPSIKGFLGGVIGTPPAWTDNGAADASPR